VKFPGGVPERWKLICEFVETRGLKECINKAKELAERRSLQKAGRETVQQQTAPVVEEKKEIVPPKEPV